MSMATQILLLWILSVAIPVATVIYMIAKFHMNDSNAGSLFDHIYAELDACKKREAALSARLEKLEKRIRAVSI